MVPITMASLPISGLHFKPPWTDWQDEKSGTSGHGGGTGALKSGPIAPTAQLANGGVLRSALTQGFLKENAPREHPSILEPHVFGVEPRARRPGK